MNVLAELDEEVARLADERLADVIEGVESLRHLRADDRLRRQNGRGGWNSLNNAQPLQVWLRQVDVASMNYHLHYLASSPDPVRLRPVLPPCEKHQCILPQYTRASIDATKAMRKFRDGEFDGTMLEKVLQRHGDLKKKFHGAPCTCKKEKGET